MKRHIFEIRMKELINEKQSQLIYTTKAAAERKREQFRLGGAEFFFCDFCDARAVRLDIL